MSVLSSVRDWLLQPVAPEVVLIEPYEPSSDAEDRPRVTLVVAGNYRQSVLWAREHGWNPRQFIYAPTLDRFLGYRPDSALVVFTGTWADEPERLEIYRHASMMGFITLSE